MDNQHKLIKGYRDLSQDEVDLMNEAKNLATQVGEFLDKIQLTAPDNKVRTDIDQRWANIAKTDLQKGFMALIRAIAQPTTF